MTATEEQQNTLDDPQHDRPKSLDDIDSRAKEAEKLDASAVNDQAAKASGAATSSDDLGNDLNTFRDDVLREWDGKDAEAVADHLEQLSKASYKVSDKAESAKNILERVSEILDDVKKKVARLAKEANDNDADNRKLIEAARNRKNSSDDESEISSAASEIERLRTLNEKDANGKKDEIEKALDKAEADIDELLEPLGLEIEDGFVELLPAEADGSTAPSSAAPSTPVGPIDTGGPAVGGGGGGDSGGGGAAAGVQGDGKPAKPIEARGDNPAKIAEQFLGRNAGDLKQSGELPAMESWVPNNVNCANFVSGCLEAGGLIDKSQGSASVAELQANLKADGWQSVPLSEAKPGDVVVSNGGGHVVMYAGDGEFIGSNNINPDGSQQISMGGGDGLVEVLTPPAG